MTTQPPPSRYKVVERGRRLEVIDTRTGERASSHNAPLPLSGGDGIFLTRRRVPPSRPAGGTAGMDADTFVTKAFYDAKAPRTIRMNFVTRKRLDGVRFGGAIVIAVMVALAFLFWPLAIAAVGLLFNPKVRRQLRAASTRFVDTLDQAA